MDTERSVNLLAFAATQIAAVKLALGVLSKQGGMQLSTVKVVGGLQGVLEDACGKLGGVGVDAAGGGKAGEDEFFAEVKRCTAAAFGGGRSIDLQQVVAGCISNSRRTTEQACQEPIVGALANIEACRAFIDSWEADRKAGRDCSGRDGKLAAISDYLLHANRMISTLAVSRLGMDEAAINHQLAGAWCMLVLSIPDSVCSDGRHGKMEEAWRD